MDAQSAAMQSGSSGDTSQTYVLQAPQSVEVVGVGDPTQFQPGFATTSEPIPRDFTSESANPKCPSTAFTTRVVTGTWNADKEQFPTQLREMALEWTQEFAWEASAAAELSPEVAQRLSDWKRAREQVLAIKAEEIEAE